MFKRIYVAPRVGAWIETFLHSAQHTPDRSHPVWVRGLKQAYGRGFQRDKRVAPRVGAWIETFRNYFLFLRFLSHPVWVRGLKPALNLRRLTDTESHPVWVRGLCLFRHN